MRTSGIYWSKNKELRRWQECSHPFVREAEGRGLEKANRRGLPPDNAQDF
jgi:hypothetical protein